MSDTEDRRDPKDVLLAMLPLLKAMGIPEPEIIEGPGFMSWQHHENGRTVTLTIAEDDA